MHQMNKNNRTKGKIKTHYGIADYYKSFKADNKDANISYSQYSKIIQRFNDELTHLIIDDNLEYVFPHLGSSISIKKDKRVPKIVNGKLYNTTPVDWVATNKLWDEDQEARDKKLLVRYNNNHTSKYVFRVFFKKHIYPVKNKPYYKFQTTRSFARALSSRIKDDSKENYDAFLLFNTNKLNK